MGTKQDVLPPGGFASLVKGYFRKYGLLGAAHRLVSGLRVRPVHRWGFLIDCPLDVRASLPPVDIDLVFSDLRPGELAGVVEMLQASDRPVSREQLQARFARGDRCFVTRHAGQVVAHVWMSASYFHISEIGQTLALAADEIYFYDLYTAPEWRGHGIAPYLIAAGGLVFQRERGTHTARCLVMAWNNPSLQAMRKVGGIRVARMGYVKLLGLNFHYVVKMV